MNTRFDKQWEKARETHNGNAMCNLIYAKSLMRGIDKLKADCNMLNYTALACNTKLGADHYRQRIAALQVEQTLDGLKRGLENILGSMIDENLERFAEENGGKGGVQ
jgi:recombination DNA repair RAD52 pathway protein